jgi:rSAM/selenodomain-associated transferase 2
MRISIIIPVLNEAASIVPMLSAIQGLRTAGHEIIVVDGDSHDDTVSLATPYTDLIITSERGRARQMNAGAKAAQGEVLLFLHADTSLPDNAAYLVRDAIGEKNHLWGRFDVVLSGRAYLFRLIEYFMNLRSRLSSIATGDQAMFMRTDAFLRVGGFDDIPLMEDIAMSKKLKRLSVPVCLTSKVVTSSRRWEEGGIARTVLLMWRLRFAYWRGADPARLAMRYR